MLVNFKHDNLIEWYFEEENFSFISILSSINDFLNINFTGYNKVTFDITCYSDTIEPSKDEILQLCFLHETETFLWYSVKIINKKYVYNTNNAMGICKKHAKNLHIETGDNISVKLVSCS